MLFRLVFFFFSFMFPQGFFNYSLHLMQIKAGISIGGKKKSVDRGSASHTVGLEMASVKRACVLLPWASGKYTDEYKS